MQHKERASVLLIYTGGTIGMAHEAKTGSLKPVDFNRISAEIPELEKFNLNLEAISFDQVIDSSDMHPDVWVKLARMVQENYERFDGFVILHGSDTMAFTASALSFMLEDLAKPVILTGSQLPIGMLRTDGKENLITAIEIAAARENGNPLVPEVAIYFESTLFRGNRTFKFNASHFDAFLSPNYPHLAKAGVQINYNRRAINYLNKGNLRVHENLDTSVTILKLFPGITPQSVAAILQTEGLRAVVMETFGSGNASSAPWFLKMLQDAIESGILVLNVTQCHAGKVQQGLYATSTGLKSIGVVEGLDMTTEAAVTKLMVSLGRCKSIEDLKQQMIKSLAGEMTI